MVIDENGQTWAAQQLCVRYVFRVEGKQITRAQAIKLNKIAKISTAIVRRETIITDTIQSRLNYLRAFEEDYYGSLLTHAFWTL